MRLRVLRLFAVLLLLGAPVFAAMPAFAHAILVESQPAHDMAVPSGKVAFSLRYNSRIDQGRSRLTLILPDKSKTVLTLAPDAAPDTLAATADLTPGSYSLHWQVLSVDGHITRGEVPFTVQGN